jgi:hypothetical protein
MRAEKAVTGAIIKAALVIIVLYLFYILVNVKEKPAPQPVGRQGVIRRVLEVLQRGFHVQSPYISEEDLREKARRYIK